MTATESWNAPQSVRISRILDLANADDMSDIDLARAVGAGLHPAALDGLSHVFGGNPALRSIIPEPTLRAGAQGRQAAVARAQRASV